MNKPLPTPEELRKLLRYEPETGKLFWRARTPSMFEKGRQTPEHKCNRWNSRCAGKEAFVATDAKGYLNGDIFSRTLKSHRVIWAIVNGNWPRYQIDHVNGIKSDNRIENLRDVSNSENCRNQPLRSVNTSGAMGVSWDKNSRKWHARISHNGKRKHLGFFDKISDAVEARMAAEIEFDYHENHGRAPHSCAN